MRKLAILVLVLLGAVLAYGQEAEFKWFDSLKLAGFEKGEFVQLQIYSDNGSKAGSPAFGFVTDKRPESIAILTPELICRRFYQRQEYGRRMECQAANLRTYAFERLETAKKASQAKAAVPTPKAPGLRENPPASQSELFVLARALTLRGEKALGQQLFETARTVSPETDFHASIEAALTTRLCEAFANREIPRSDVVKIMEAFVARFPNNPYTEWCKEQIPIWAGMVAEERKHVSRPLASMTVDEQVAELIYRFRDIGSGWGPAPLFPTSRLP